MVAPDESIEIPPLTVEILRNLFAKLQAPDACWLWTASVRGTYPQLGVDGKTYRAHRMFFEWLKEPIPPGYTIDHTCRNRLCVNPAHLKAVTQRVNTLATDSPIALNARKQFCKRGHEFTPENTAYFKNQSGNQSRRCRTCNRGYAKEARGT